MKKVLFFFPENPLKKDSGNKTRVLELLKYFSGKNFEVDFVGPEYSDFNETDARLLEQTKLVKNCYLIRRKPKKQQLLSYLFQFKLPSLFYKRSTILNYVTFNFQKEFNEILARNSYDYILISYVGWADLIKGNELVKKAKTIIDTHDLATVQAKNDKNFELGTYFQREIDSLDLFDEAWAISPEEYFVFSQFSKSKIRLVPFVIKNNFDALQAPKWDLIYIASANTHNTLSARWFFDNVYPLLPKTLNICVIGKISATISDYPNVTKYLAAVDLNQFYAESRIALCPMLSGSGVKIKVIEALSFGLPVVCNARGVDGLPEKVDNGCLVTDNADAFAGYILKLSGDVAFYNQISEKSKVFFTRNFDLEESYKRLDDAFVI